MQVLGIDVGGTGIKGAPVDTSAGVLLEPRLRLPTPFKAKPGAVAKTIAMITQNFAWNGPIGVGFPGVAIGGIIHTAANVHPSWIGTHAAQLFSENTGCPVHVLNDADAAGMAEMTFGTGKGVKGVVLLVTIGTGLGTVMFTDGHLVPNTEFGHIEIDGFDAEQRASDAARKREKLSWKKWGKRFNKYLCTVEKLTWPELIILGGGLIKQKDKFFPYLTVHANVLPAQFGNDAGIVGAALAARGALQGKE